MMITEFGANVDFQRFLSKTFIRRAAVIRMDQALDITAEPVYLSISKLCWGGGGELLVHRT